jgi:hypothetical protein
MSSQKVATGSLAILTFVTLCLNVALVVQNRKLKATGVPQVWLPAVGTKIQKLEGLALDGSRLNLPFAVDSKRTILFVFSTTCRVCDLNWPAWKSIQQSADARRYRLAYANVRSSLSRAYLSQHNILDELVFAELDPRSIVALNLVVTPITVLLGADGTVEDVWPGLLEGDELKGVRNVLISR